ncbi:MAG: guanylate kinase [Candidatus Bipolaricaulota bacterium]
MHEPSNEFLPCGWEVQGRRGIALVVAGPSGAGKSSVIEEILRRDSGLSFSVSATTRARRPDEVHGRDYYFMSSEGFQQMADSGELLEWAEYHGRRYGTLRSEVESRLATGQDVLLNVEVKGALAIRAAELVYPVVLVFLVPPDREELARRLRGRGTESREELDKRMAIAEEEITYIPSFNFLVVNERVELAAQRIQSVLTAERCRVVRCPA